MTGRPVTPRTSGAGAAPRLRLQHPDGDLTLTLGTASLGRGPSCDMVLDDALASRLHAQIVTDTTGSTIADLDSANGTWVNGARISAPRVLVVGDWLSIGRVEMRVVDAVDNFDPRASHTRPTNPARATSGDPRSASDSAPDVSATAYRSGASGSPDTFPRPRTGSPFMPLAPGAPPPGPSARTRPRPRPATDPVPVPAPALLAEVRIERTGEPRSAAPAESTGRADAFSLFGDIADRAIAAGEGERAEQILSAQFRGILEMARVRSSVPLEAAEFMARYAVRLATMTQKATWIDGMMTVYTVVRRPLPVAVLDELESSRRRLPPLDAAALRAYVEALRGAVERLSPGERVLVHRIAALEQPTSGRS